MTFTPFGSYGGPPRGLDPAFLRQVWLLVGCAKDCFRGLGAHLLPFAALRDDQVLLALGLART